MRLQAEALSILRQGGREEAFNKLQLVAQSDPGRADALYALSEIAIDLRLFDQADQILQKCKATDPTNPSCTFQIVSLRVYQNRFMEAVSEYERARRDGSYNPWLEEPVGYARMGHCDLAAAQDHFRALEQSGRTLASTVHFRASQDGMADAVLYQGRLRDARQQILHALETSNSNYDKASYYSTLALMDALHGRAPDALSEAKASVQPSEAPDIALSAARALAMAGDFTARVRVQGMRSDVSSAGAHPWAQPCPKPPTRDQTAKLGNRVKPTP